MSFDAAARKYLGKLQTEIAQAERTGAYTDELSYRLCLDEFFKELMPQFGATIKSIAEPKRRFRRGPDWVFYDEQTMGVYGNVEAKGPDPDNLLPVGSHKEQVEKYLELGYRVILTDGLDFIFFSPGKGRALHSPLVNKPVNAQNWENLSPNPALENQFRAFFKSAEARRCSEQQLVEEVAKRAKLIAKSVEDLADLSPDMGDGEIERKTIEALRELKKMVEEHHDPALRNRKAFADFVAQVLTFGLLYAHRVVRGRTGTPAERYRQIRNFWSGVVHRQYTERLRPFKALVGILGDELNLAHASDAGSVGALYDDCCRLLAHIELEETQRDAPDYHKLYEQFLTVFDPKTRFDFGAFYTPEELAAYAVRLVKAITKTEVHGVSLYSPNNKLIDPCCGTGTFLEWLIREAPSSRDLPTVIGFEILPTPYALAHYRLTMLNAEQEYLRNLSVVLTNTLSDKLEDELSQKRAANLIEAEQAVARKLSRPPLTLIIGNPPSSDSQVRSEEKTHLSIILELMNDFRPPEEKRTDRQNVQKQLLNDCMLFLRWACNRLQESPTGILAFVLPESFAEHTSYLYARKWLMEHFQKLWVLEIDKDIRRGVATSNLFKTQQGRLLLVGLMTQSESQTETQLRCGSLADLDSRSKNEELRRERDADGYLSMFRSFPIRKETYALRPGRSYNTRQYTRFWALYPDGKQPRPGEKYIFARHCSGLKLAPTGLFVHANEAILERRSRDVADAGIAFSDLNERWFSGQDKPIKAAQVPEDVRHGFAAALKNGKAFVRYAYRPLVTIHAFIDEPILRTLAGRSGGGTRYRPEILSAFRAQDTIGFAVAPAPKDVGDELHRFVSFCWGLPDNDLCKRGNAQILCNVFPLYKQAQWNPAPISNVNAELTQLLAEQSGATPDEISERLVYYAYAVMCSGAFLKTFEGVMFGVASAKTKCIPIAVDPKLFAAIADKGERLALLEKPDANLPVPAGFEKRTQAHRAEFELGNFKIDEAVGTIRLYARDKSEVLIVKELDTQTLNYQVAGYQIIQQWLKIHSWRYMRTKFTAQHQRELFILIRRIELQRELITAIDEDVMRLLADDTLSL
jgi:type I restriction-modification system DNA methylase subunit